MRALFHRPAVLGLAIALTSPLVAQERLGGFGGPQHEAYGEMVETVGDLDGDGIDDVMIGAPWAIRPGVGLRAGRVEVVSGATITNATPTVLFDVLAPARYCSVVGYGANFGRVGAGGRDVTGDGVPDFVASSPVSSQVFVFDGTTGIDVLEGSGFDLYGGCLWQHGTALALADINGDAHADVLVSAIDTSIVGRARFWVYDGASIANPSTAGPQLLYRHFSPLRRDRIGAAIAVLGDMDGDGLDDFAVGAPGNTTAWPNGSVAVFSGGTGALLHRFGASVSSSAYGTDVTSMGDLDGDGITDLAVADPLSPSTTPGGNVEVVSGAWILSGGSSGPRTLWTARPDPASSFVSFGQDIRGIDVNGDGRRDLIATRLDRTTPGATRIGWQAVSGRTGEFMWDFDHLLGSADPRLAAAAAVASGSDLSLLLGAPTAAESDQMPVGYGYVFVLDAHDGRGETRAPGVGCPCGNDDPRAGCANATGSGAVLAIESGSTRLAVGALEATTTGLPPSSFGFLLGGAPRSPITLGNGVLGVSNIIRMPPVQVSPSGTAVMTGDLLGDFAGRAPMFGAAAPMVGVPFAMQFAYRDTDCAGVQTSAFNLSNAYVIVPRP